MAAADRIRWDARYRSTPAAPPGLPAALLLAEAARLPSRGRALDVAGGTGRNALFLARCGLDTTIVDVSPVGLARAAAAAQQAQLPLHTLALDLELVSPPPGPWAVIFVANYLQRDLLPRLAAGLGPGGLLLFSQPTQKNLERHARPSARFLLVPGELDLGVSDLVVERYDEAWRESQRHEAWWVGRRPL